MDQAAMHPVSALSEVLVEMLRWKSVAITTSRFHQPRAYMTFCCAAQQAFGEGDGPMVSPKGAVNDDGLWA